MSKVFIRPNKATQEKTHSKSNRILYFIEEGKEKKKKKKEIKKKVQEETERLKT